jgi:hypothetical protein
MTKKAKIVVAGFVLALALIRFTPHFWHHTPTNGFYMGFDQVAKACGVKAEDVTHKCRWFSRLVPGALLHRQLHQVRRSRDRHHSRRDRHDG